MKMYPAAKYSKLHQLKDNLNQNLLEYYYFPRKKQSCSVLANPNHI